MPAAPYGAAMPSQDTAMRFAFLIAAATALSACSTVATATIENRLVNIGLSEQRAGCMADELDARLDDDDMTKLARHTINLSRSDTPGEALDALASIDDFGIARAVVASGTACLFSAR